ncbi:MAG: DEAD/DEAH box helicase [Ginsengibacter sp.]
MQIVETIKDYEISFPYDERMVHAVKSISGAWYQGNKRTWHIPRHRQREIENLKRVFKVTASREENDMLLMPEQIGEIAPLPDLDVELPMLLKKPFTYQENGIAYIRQQKKVIIGDQMGLGKSLEAIAALCSFGVNKENNYLTAGPGLVICPSSLKLNWQSEWKDVAGKRAVILDNKIKRSWEQYYKVGMSDVFIVNYESLKKYFVEPGWKKPTGTKFRVNNIPFLDCINIFKWVIVDESHKIKDSKTIQSKLVMGLARGKEIIMELSGTPLLNLTEDLIAQLHVIDRLRDIVSHIPQPLDKYNKPSDFGGYQRFMGRYCSGPNRCSNLKELNYRLNKYCYFRREKSEVLKDLPDKIRQVIRCEITNRPEYDTAIEEFKIFLKETKDSEDPAIKKRRAALAMIKIGHLKSISISAKGKLEAAREYIEDITGGGQKIVVFIHLKEISRALKEMFPEAVTITGDDSMEQRNQATYEFQKCKQCGVRLEGHQNQNHAHIPSNTKIIICSSAGGEGLTLTAASNVLMVEFPWTYGKCEQYEDRCHRISQYDSVTAAYLLGYKTVDEYCYYDIVMKKKEISNEVTGASDDVAEEMIDHLINLFNK